MSYLWQIFLSDTKAMIKSLDWIILIVSALIGIGIIYRYKGQVVPKKIGVALLILCCVYFLTLGW